MMKFVELLTCENNTNSSNVYKTRIYQYPTKLTNKYLTPNNPCFQCNTAITNFLISNTCEIRFHDVIGQSTVPMYSYAKILKHG